jgi:hypothetical protein
MSFKVMQDALSRKEMQKIMAGSGSASCSQVGYCFSSSQCHCWNAYGQYYMGICANGRCVPNP